MDPLTIIGTIIATLLTGIGAILLFIANYFVSEIKRLQTENKEDRAAANAVLAALAKPLEMILQNQKNHEENTQKSLKGIEALSSKSNERRTTTRRKTE